MNQSDLYKKLPDSPGVYLMKDGAGRIIYVGKAVNLKRRVTSYFLACRSFNEGGSRSFNLRIEQLVNETKSIDYKKTDSALEALILESKLIKQYTPKFNVREKDDKSFLYIEITKEEFPRVLLVRGKDTKSQKLKAKTKYYGPFTSAGSVREALKILRRIFPWSTHADACDAKNANRMRMTRKEKYNSQHLHTFVVSHHESAKRPCFDYEIGLCPGTCIGAINREDYLKNIKRLKLFLAGKKGQIVKSLQKEMKTESRALEFEKAERLRRQIFALKHIRDTALVNEEPFLNSKSSILNSYRIEGYDISNISGDSAVGSMVVFSAGGETSPLLGGDVFRPNKDQYRKFKIKSLSKSDDVGMIKEILRRRFHNDWPLPNVILVDGGKGQVNAARVILKEGGLKIPVVGIAKGPERKKNEFIGIIPRGVDPKTLIRVRDETHRFAIKYHKELRARNFLKS